MFGPSTSTTLFDEVQQTSLQMLGSVQDPGPANSGQLELAEGFSDQMGQVEGDGSFDAGFQVKEEEGTQVISEEFADSNMNIEDVENEGELVSENVIVKQEEGDIDDNAVNTSSIVQTPNLSSPSHCKESTEESNEESNDIDKVLKALYLCPLQTAKVFILATKLKSSEDSVLPLLQKCKKLKYIDQLESSVWVMKPKGVEYIKGKLGATNTELSKSTNSMEVPPARDLTKKFVGPPPSPFELLGGKGKFSKSSGNSSGGYSSMQGLPTTSGQLTGGYSVTKPMSAMRGQAQSSYSGKQVIPSTSNLSTNKDESYSSMTSQSQLGLKTTSSSMSSNKAIPSLFDVDTTSSPMGKLLNWNQSGNSRISSLQGHQEQTSMPYHSEMHKFDDPFSHDFQASQRSNFSANHPMNSHGHMSSSQSLPSFQNVHQRLQNHTQRSNTQSVQKNTTSNNSGSGFKPPPTPVDLVRQQLKKTDISPPNSYSSPSGFSQGSSQAISHSASVFGHNHSSAMVNSRTSSHQGIMGNQQGMMGNQPPVCISLASSGIQRLMNTSRPVSHNVAETTSSLGMTVTLSGQHRTVSPNSSNFQNTSMKGLNHGMGQNAVPQPLLSLNRGPQSLPAMGGGPQSLSAMGGPGTAPVVSGPRSLGASPATGNPGLSSESFAALTKNPVSALMEYAQSRKSVATIEVIRQSGPSHRPK